MHEHFEKERERLIAAQNDPKLAEDDLELLILLSLPPQCQDYRHMSPYSIYTVLKVKP